MAELLVVPEVAAGATEVVLSEWLVTPGAPVRAGDPVAVVETEKAIVEVESVADGVLLATLAAPGLPVGVGAPMALLGEPAEVGIDVAALLAGLGAAAPAPVATVVPTDRVFASPLARRMLRDAGIPVERVNGTGPGGRVVRRDVEQAIATAETPVAPVAPVAPAPVDAAFTEEPHSRHRRAVATRMVQSKREVPHFYLRRTARADALLGVRREVNAQTSVRVSVNDLVLRAVGLAHRAVPEANVTWTDDALRHHADIDVAVAVDSARGLVTPVLRKVDTLTLAELSAAVRAVVERADEGRLHPQELEGGSITVTNLGMHGVEEFAAIINPPQSAILAVGAVRPTPVVVDGDDGPRVEVASTVQLTLSVDHRAIDGALAARWLDALVAVLESPFRLLV
jgi:pyruvate dehydrogenase E2 component (dihydrolipoamide acetyltransferase)